VKVAGSLSGTGLETESWPTATEVTRKEREPAEAVASALALTEGSELVGATALQVVALPSDSAEVSSEAYRAFTLWYAFTTVWVAETLVFNAVWGSASACMRELIRAVVSSPEIRPSTEKPAMRDSF
jgi:hypothetical protein